MSAAPQRWPAPPPSVPGLPLRPLVMWAPYRYGVFSWLQSQDQQIAETVDFLRGEILKGVTDGSDAQPGQIGQWVRLLTPAFAVPATALVQSVPIGTLQPGDWDCWAELVFGQEYSYAELHLEPVPAGFSDNMFAKADLAGAGYLSGDSVTTSTVRALLAAATPVAFQVTTNLVTPPGLTAGTGTILFNARRRR